MRKSNDIRIQNFDKIKKIDAFGVLVMFSCVNIEYLNLRVTGLQTLTFYMRLFLYYLSLLEVCLGICNNKKLFYLEEACFLY